MRVQFSHLHEAHFHQLEVWLFWEEDRAVSQLSPRISGASRDPGHTRGTQGTPTTTNTSPLPPLSFTLPRLPTPHPHHTHFA